MTRNVSLQHCVQNGSDAHIASSAMDDGNSFPGSKDAEASFSDEINNAWSHISIPLYFFMRWYLINHKDNFILPYILLDNCP
jgi:hypothetical protein